MVLFVARERKEAELGYRLRRMDWGQGFAAEGASALVNLGFRCGGYDKIVSSTMAVNQASRRVLEKIGMNYVRTVPVDSPDRFPGSEQGEVQYELDTLGRGERVIRRLAAILAADVVG